MDNREKFHRWVKNMTHVGDCISEIKKEQSFKEKYTRKHNENQTTDYGVDWEERHHGGESYFRVAGINCTFGD